MAIRLSQRVVINMVSALTSGEITTTLSAVTGCENETEQLYLCSQYNFADEKSYDVLFSSISTCTSNPDEYS